MTTRLKFNSNDQRDDKIFVNALPLFRKGDVIVFEGRFYHQLQTYKDEIPDIFNYNEALIVSDGLMVPTGQAGVCRR